MKFKNNLKKFYKYGELLNEVFNKPPCIVTQIVEDIMKRYPIELFTIGDRSAILLIHISNGFYGISWIATKKEYRNKGYATSIIQHILKKYKGTFIVKANAKSKSFYEKNGFICVNSENPNKPILVLVNNIEKIDF